MIGLYLIKIFHKYTKEKLTEVEVVGSTHTAMETDKYQKRKALRAAGLDPNIEKYSTDKFTFKANLIKQMEP